MEASHSKNRFKTWLKLGIAGFILLVLFTVVIKQLEQPSTGTVKESVTEVQDNISDNKDSTISAKYFSLKYDGSFNSVVDISEGDKTALEVYRIAGGDSLENRNIVITIKDLPGDGIVGESSYRIRQNNSDQYTEKTETVGENIFITMEKSDGSELTGFTTYDRKLAMVSYTLATPGDDLRNEAISLLSQFRWMK